MAMGEFRRTHSKVWWSHYPEDDEEDPGQGGILSPHWGPGLSLSGERRFSSSPSNGSHKSQDSGFSDSESSSPSGSTRSASGSGIRQLGTNKTPLKEESSDETTNEEAGAEATTTRDETGSEKEPKTRFVDPNFLLHIPLSRIPRVCLSHKSKTSSDPNGGSPKIAPNKNLILDVNKKETNCNESNSRYPIESNSLSIDIKPMGQCYQSDSHFRGFSIRRPSSGLHSVSLEIQKSSYQLPIKFSSIDCLLNEQNLYSSLNNKNSHSCSSLNDKDDPDEESSSPPTPKPKPSRKSTCFIVDEIPKKSYIEATRNSSFNSDQILSTNTRSNCSSIVKIGNDRSSNAQISSVAPAKSETKEVTEADDVGDKAESQSLTFDVGKSDSVSTAASETTIRFLGNIDLAKASGGVDRINDRNLIDPNLTSRDKTLKSCNLSWSPIKTEADLSEAGDEFEDSHNKTVVFGYVSTVVNDLPGAPAHTSTPKGTQINLRSRQCYRKTVQRKGLFQEAQSNRDASVAQWLYELGTRYDAECMTTLHHKCLVSNTNRQVSVMAAASSQFVRDLQRRTKAIANEFSKLYRHVESESKEQLSPLIQSLVGHLNDFMDYLRKTLSESASGFSTKEARDLSKLSVACNRLKATTNEIPLNFRNFSADLSHLGKLFSQFVDHLLKCQIKSLIQILEEPASDVTLLSALSGLTGMGLEGTHLASLVARCDGVRAILSICLDSRWTTVRVAALRTLATVCCSALSIRQLEKAKGVEVLADVLSDDSKPEAELSEAASVLAQITAPWIEDNHKVEGLQDFLNIFVTSLTRLVQKTKSSETLLLSSAALANLSFMEPRAIYALLEMGSAGYLLAAIRKLGARASVFLQEQAATMVANMAAVPETREHLAKHRAVVALLCFLQVRHSPLQRASEIAASERLQHKSAIALSRLCSDPEVSQQVVELHGVGRLVRLCKEKRERNHSDAVLVACLAALRKITKNCGTTIMEEHDVSQLVEPRLLDSFLTYSSKQESYV